MRWKKKAQICLQTKNKHSSNIWIGRMMATITCWRGLCRLHRRHTSRTRTHQFVPIQAIAFCWWDTEFFSAANLSFTDLPLSTKIKIQRITLRSYKRWPNTCDTTRLTASWELQRSAFFSVTARSNLERPKLSQMSLHRWEWKNNAIPLVPKLPSLYSLPEEKKRKISQWRRVVIDKLVFTVLDLLWTIGCQLINGKYSSISWLFRP